MRFSHGVRLVKANSIFTLISILFLVIVFVLDRSLLLDHTGFLDVFVFFVFWAYVFLAPIGFVFAVFWVDKASGYFKANLVLGVIWILFMVFLLSANF